MYKECESVNENNEMKIDFFLRLMAGKLYSPFSIQSI